MPLDASSRATAVPAAEVRTTITDRLLRDLIALAASAQHDRITPAEAELVMAALPACLEELALHRARAAAEADADAGATVIALPVTPRLINDAERRGAAIACDTLARWGRQIERNAAGMPGATQPVSDGAILAHTGRYLAGCADLLRRRLTAAD